MILTKNLSNYFSTKKKEGPKKRKDQKKGRTKKKEGP
jgi:hypothetical protein